jgi:hypothetical protein
VTSRARRLFLAFCLAATAALAAQEGLLADLPRSDQTWATLTPPRGPGTESRLAASAGHRDAATRQPVFTIRHLERTPKGWLVAETANFRIYHKQGRRQAEQVARSAEQARAALSRKWFGTPAEPWYARCAIYVHPSRLAYFKTAGLWGAVGHAQAKMEGDRTFTRTIHLAAGVPLMVEASVPHEVSHLVMNDRFGGRLPRWANEGMAMLAEPDAARADRQRQLLEFRRKRALFALDVLLEADRADETNTLEFYAQSFSVTDFLVAAQGPRTFIRFLGDSRRSGYEAALRQHYGIRNFADLERRWRAYAFDQPLSPPGLAHDPAPREPLP